MSEQAKRAPSRLNTSGRSRGSLHDWLQEQAIVHRVDSSSRSVSSETTESSEASSSGPPQRPPRVARTPSISSQPETVKRRPPPPVPDDSGKEPRRKSLNSILMPDEVDEIDAETVTEELWTPDERVFEVEMDDTKYSGKTVFRIIPVSPAAPPKTHIISNKSAKEAVENFDDDAFLDRLSQCDFTWSGISCIRTGDPADAGAVSLPMSCPQRWRFVLKPTADNERGKKKKKGPRWEKMPLSPGRKTPRPADQQQQAKDGPSQSNNKTLENEVETLRNRPVSFAKPDDEVDDDDDDEDDDSSNCSDWSAEEIDANKHNSSRFCIQVNLPQFEETLAKPMSPILTSMHPPNFQMSQRALVFEKVGDRPDIADDYLFHRSIAGLTSATERNIIQRINQSMDSPDEQTLLNNMNASPPMDESSQHASSRSDRLQMRRPDVGFVPTGQRDLMQIELQRQRELQLAELQQRQQQQQQQLALEIAKQQQLQRQQQLLAAEAERQQQQQQQQTTTTTRKAARKHRHQQQEQQAAEADGKMQQQQQLALEAARKQQRKQHLTTQRSQQQQQSEPSSPTAVPERRPAGENDRSGGSSQVNYRDRVGVGSNVVLRDRSSGSSQASNRHSSQLYEELPEESGNKRISIHSDEFILQYGRNIRYLSLAGSESPGFTVCGGNISGTFVLTIQSDSAAYKAGLRVGDQIVGINGKLIKSLSKEEIYHVLQQPTSEPLVIVVVRDDDRFRLASTKNAVGDSFFVRARFNYTPSSKKGELAVKEDDIFIVSDSMPEERPGFWQAKKVLGTFNEPEGYIPNRQRAEKIVTTQRLMMHPDAAQAKQRGGALMRSFRRSKSTDRSAGRGEHGGGGGGGGGGDSKTSSEAGDIVTYERVVQQKSPTKRPVVLMGLFCDAVCAMLAKDSPGIYEFPNVEVERYPPGSDEMSLDLGVVRSIVNRCKHCVMVVSPKAVNFIRDKTEFRPIVIYLSPVSKSVVASVKERLAPALDKKIGIMFEEATKFEKYHAALFDAMVPYKTDSSWFSLLKETVERFQRQPQWTPVEISVPDLDSGDTSPDIIKTTRGGGSSSKSGDVVKHASLTTDDIPDQIQDLLSQQATDARTGARSSDVNNNRNGNNNNNNNNIASDGQPKKSILKNRENHNRSLASIDFKISSFQTGPKPAVAVKPPRAAFVSQYEQSPRKPFNKNHSVRE
jgi:hypothetical protein